MDTKTKGNIPVTSSKGIAKPSMAVTHSVADMDGLLIDFLVGAGRHYGT